MARLMGVDIPNEKMIRYALRYVYGVGPKVSDDVLAEAGINPTTKAKDLTEEELARIASTLEKGQHQTEGQLRRQLAVNIQRLKDIGCYRGLRHRRGLPVRGQRTQSNARSRKGPKKTVAGKKGLKGK